MGCTHSLCATSEFTCKSHTFGSVADPSQRRDSFERKPSLGPLGREDGRVGQTRVATVEGLEEKDQDVPCVQCLTPCQGLSNLHFFFTVGPVVEAFGYSRIIFGSSPSPSSHSQSNAGDWYQIARDSLLELGVDQEAVDNVFGLNAKRVYDLST